MPEKYWSLLYGASSSLLLSLGITLLVEVIVAIIWGRRSKRDIFWVLIINIITNPIVNAILFIGRYYMPLTNLKIIEYILEVLVFLSEGIFYKKCFKDFKYPFLLSLSANIASYGAGLLYMEIFC